MRDRILSLFILPLGIVPTVTAQQDKAYILEQTDVKALLLLGAELAEQERRDLEVALAKARENGWPTENLVKVDELGRPMYQAPTNDVAAGLTQTLGLRSTFGVQGQGMVIDLFEAADNGAYAARTTHQDLTGRVTIQGGNVSPSSHATHVAGTLIGSPPGGVSTSSRGMSPAATLKSFPSSTMLSASSYSGTAGVLISNNSWGYPAGWKNEGSGGICFGGSNWRKWTWLGGSDQFSSGGDDPNFGRYSNEASIIDEICRLAPMHLPVFAAGNYDNDDPQNQTLCDDEVRNGTSGSYVEYDATKHTPGNSSQTSTISLIGNAKNILTVGNLQDDLYLNASSSRGMTDDGRIKPDLCGNGTDLYSADSGSDTHYSLKTGTSMACPNVAGSLLLLHQVYNNLHPGLYMRSATLKGLAIHTAADLGTAGPDVTYGWGILQAHAAGQVIASDHAGSSHKILEIPAPTGLAHTFYSDGSMPIRVTLCYTDQAGIATSVHNDQTKKLVNDLDLTVARPGAATAYPYVLDMGNPSAAATTGDNDRDNVEQIYIPAPAPGLYEVRVNVEGSLTGTQPFSLIISGRQPCSVAGNITHGAGPIAAGTYVGNQITSLATVQSGSTVSYQAVTNISLTPGFNAPSGSHFIGRILDCQ